jgi:hypothetical protein
MKSITPSPRPPLRYATSMFSCSALDNASISTLSERNEVEGLQIVIADK